MRLRGAIALEAAKIGDRRVGRGQPVFIIAEAGVNHSGDVELARRMVGAAAEAGADAVKFQTFKAHRLVGPRTPKAKYQLEGTDPSESQLEMLKSLELAPGAHGELQSYCRDRGVMFMSSPFDEESADLLEKLGVPVFKIGSGEITNLPFLEHLARKGRPIILSTGMSYMSEVDEAVRVIRGAGCDELILLHCVTNYPADPAEANLRAMQTMARAFGLPAGYSDHTRGIEMALAAVALGACVIEKHFTLDRGLPGPDHEASLEPDELAAMVRSIRNVEAGLGHGRKEPAASETGIKPLARKSLVAARDLEPGATLREADVAVRRPGSGISPGSLSRVLGMRIQQHVSKDEPLTWEAFHGDQHD